MVPKKGNQATIKDIARQLNISPSTVSRALKNNPKISLTTRKKVLDLAKRLKYEPNRIALGLKSQSTKTIGVLIPEIIHFFFSTIISGIEEIAYSRGYTVMFCQSNESYEKEVLDTKALLSHRVDGILASYSRETTNFAHFQEIKNRHIPIVFFDRIPDGVVAPKVAIDDYQAAKTATQHLIDQSCRKIAHLAGPLTLELGQKRLKGYLSALEENDLPEVPEYIIDAIEGTKERGYLCMNQLLDLAERPDAVFANNDMIALGAMMAIKEAGLKIPQDIAVVGFSNWQFCSLVEPQLSSIAQPGLEMGRLAATLLFDLLEDKPVPNVNRVRVLETELVVRDSSLRLTPPN